MPRKTSDSFPIDFGQGIEKTSSVILQNPNKYFDSTLDFILSKHKPLQKSIQLILAEKIEEQVNDTIRDLAYLERKMKDYNLFDILKFGGITDYFTVLSIEGKTPPNIDYILTIYNFFKNHKEELDDISDRKKRDEFFFDMFKKFRKGMKDKYEYWVDLEKCLKIAGQMRKDDETKAIQRGLQVQSNIRNLYEDINNASTGLCRHENDLYIQFKER